MVENDKERQDPFKGKGEPAEELGLTRPAALSRRQSKRRQAPPRPAEKRRRKRQLSVTFSDESTPDRLRALALEWALFAPDGKSPNVSAVVEALLLPQIEKAEKGEIERPSES